MKAVWGLLGGLVLSTAAFAYNVNGRDAAARLCASLSFSSDQDRCMAIVRDATFFERGAVAICEGLSFTSDRLQCLTTIKEKAYEDFDIDFCARKNFTSERLSCLASSGKEFREEPLPSIRELREDLGSALYDLRRGDSRRAEDTLERVLRRLR